MEASIRIKQEYTSLDKLIDNLKSNSPYEISKEYDHWDVRTGADGKMEQCLVIKKSKMHGAKAYFANDDTLQVSYIIPNKMMNAYFGKSQKARRNVIELVAEKLKNAVLANSQRQAFEELVTSFDKLKY